MNWIAGVPLAVLALLNCGACAPVDDLGALSQPNARHPPKYDEIRPIQWGDLNFLHTTDTHGWLAGHLLERQFSADWGDFVSFSERLHELADERGADLLLVDSGDRHDGNGLSDASKRDGRLSLPIFCEVDYDIVTIGNHELYRGAASLQEFHEIRSRFKDRYVVSNVEVSVGRTWIPLGNKYRLFRTKNQNLTVLAFGFLFNFEGNDKDVSRVTKVEDEIEKPWFQRVLREIVPTVDYIVVAGHIPVHDFPEFGYILDKIRTVSKTVPVSMFGGHSHIRDFRVFDDHAVGLQSGRYCETIGWSSVNISQDATQEFGRSYIDFNQKSFARHAGSANDAPLLTEHGKRVSDNIAAARKKLDLDKHRATAPQNYYTDRAPFPSKDSLYSLFQDKVLPLLTSPDELEDRTRYILLNTGAVRFDLFKGPYTKDTGFILTPFRNQWFYISHVPRHVADQILPIINGFDRVLAAKSRYTEGSAEGLDDRHNSEQTILGKKQVSYGYRTVDDLGDDGDDTVHRPWKFHPMPNAFQTVTEGSRDPDSVALIFHDFVASFVEKALVQLGREDLYEPVFHGGEEIIDLLPRYLNTIN